MDLNYRTKSYPAKVLLFGEYTVINGSGAIGIPFPKFFSSWVYGNKVEEDLAKLFDFLATTEIPLDHKKMDSDLGRGLVLESSIPFGCGLGSSGNICAAILDRYGLSPDEKFEDLLINLRRIENYFHGSSSGLDPLIVYLNTPIKVEGEKFREISNNEEILSQFFIFPSQIERDVSTLIETFQTKLEDAVYKRKIEGEYLPLLSLCMHKYEHNFKGFDLSMQQLSLLQLELFSEMIPDAIMQIWQDGLKDDSYYLKLCGAGGGGYFMGYSVSGSEIPQIDGLLKIG